MALAANSVEGQVEDYVARIETLLGELASERGAFMEKAKEIRGDIKEIYFEAKQAGVLVKALRGIIMHRDLTKRQRKIPVGMDGDSAAMFETLIDTLGDLGRAAARSAGYEPGKAAKNWLDGDPVQNDQADFPAYDEKRPADQEHLDKVGRGPVKQ